MITLTAGYENVSYTSPNEVEITVFISGHISVFDRDQTAHIIDGRSMFINVIDQAEQVYVRAAGWRPA